MVKKSKRIFFILVAVLTLAATLVYLRLSAISQKALVEQILHREQVISRAGARAMEVFVKDLQSSIAALADDPTPVKLQKFVAGSQPGPVAGVIITDSEGKVKLSVNREAVPLEPGTSVANHDYFAWAKTASSGEVDLGQPIVSKVGASKGKYILPVSTPIVKAGQFQGVLTVAVLLEDLTSRYLEPLKLSEETRIYLLNPEGVILSKDGEQSIAEGLNQALAAGKEQKLDLVLADEQRAGRLTRFLIAAAPIELKNCHWLLAVISPVEEAHLFSVPFRQSFSWALILFLLIIFILSIFGILYTKIVHQDAYEEGYSDGYYRGSKVRDGRKKKG